MKQVLMISRCPPYPIYLGDRLIIYHIARELAQRGHKIDLLAYANRPEDQEIDWADSPFFRHVEVLPEPRRTQVHYLSRALLPGTRFPREADRSWSPEMWRAVQGYLGRERYDVVHLFGGIQVYELLHALGSVPAIIVPYESYSLYLRRMVESGGDVMTRLQYWMARQFESWMFTPYRRTVMVSERDKAELLGINPDLAVDVIPNGIDLSYFRPQNGSREPAVLLFTGNYEYAPNIDAALHLAQVILPQVRQRVPNARLWLVGNAPPPALQALEGDGIRVTGRVPDVRPYLAEATAFVSPLRLGAGIKNKVLEAMAMGLPVVATPVSIDGIQVRHAHDVLVADSDTALVDSVVRLLGDPALQEALALNGRALIETRYSWSQVAAAYEALYETVQYE